MSNKNPKNRITKSVYFGLTDPYDVQLWEHARQINPITGKERNFSKYVRRLIEEDMRREQNGGNNQVSAFTIIDKHNDDDEEYTLDVKNAMNSFL